MNRSLYIVPVAIALVSGGCKMAPKYDRPAVPTPAEWPTGGAYGDTQASAGLPQATTLQWREFFCDDKLQKLIELALRNNRDLRLAALNVERARAMYRIQQGELLPSVHAAGTANVQRLPADLSSKGVRQTTERYDVNLGVASWEIDLFGRIRSFKDRALEEYFATQHARNGAQIMLVSSVARAYLGLAADRESLNLAKTTLETQQNAYNLIKRRFDLGLITELDLSRARTQVESARGDVARFEQQAVQALNALSLLLGTTAPGELLPVELSGITPPKDLSPGVSSEVLLSRPDVLQAETQLRAAHADIGAARATLFPRISLTAAVGTASSDLTGLFKTGSGAWSYAPQIAMPIFDTRSWSALKATKVQREQAVAQYEKAIQSAFREIADALAVRGTMDQQLSAQQSLVEAVAKTHALSQSRYDKGIDSYLSVLDAQRTLYGAQQGLVSLRFAKLANQVTLYAVLGGGWQPEPTQPSVSLK